MAKDAELSPPKNAELPPAKNSARVAFIDQLTKDFRFPQNTEKDAISDERVKAPVFTLLNKSEDSVLDTSMKDTELSASNKAVKSAEFVTVNAVELKLVCDIEEMKSKLNHLEAKLNEAESIISKLTEERKLSIQERNNLHEELALSRNGSNAKRVQVGFPLLFVVMVALVSTFLGYHSHP